MTRPRPSPIVLLLAVLLPALCAAAGAADKINVFSWRHRVGETLRIMLPRGPYAAGVRARLMDFEHVSGIRVAFAVYPAETYFPRLDAAFASRFGQPDVYMTDLSRLRKYVRETRMTMLDEPIANPSLTRQIYNIADFFPALLGAFRWGGRDGSPVGKGALWAIPAWFEGETPGSAAGEAAQIWAFAVNPATKNPDAAWLLVQYFTSHDFQLSHVPGWKTIRPPRQSVFGPAGREGIRANPDTP